MPGKKKSARKPAKRTAARHNPPLVVLGNPRGARLLSHEIFEVRYRHAADGRPYKHTFRPGAKILLLPNGDVLLRAANGRRLWNTYQVNQRG